MIHTAYTYATLDNGMRAVHVSSPSDIDLTGVMINAGSRMDPSESPGLAHFVEHTIFKGTAHRRSWHINSRMEAIGGELNAFTSKEETVIYTVSPGGNLQRALQLIGELVTEPTFPEHELDIERAVIMDEIDSYLDSPPDAVFDDFEDEIFAGSGLGHNILGTHESVKAIGSSECRRFVDNWYTPRRMTAFYSGSTNPDRVFAHMNRHLGTIVRPERQFTDATPCMRPPFTIVRHKEGAHQANTVTGARIGGITSSDRHAIALLCNMLGGPGMNSLLNLELRERRGLVYSVDASVTRYNDCGILAIGYGCDPEDTDKCRKIVTRVLGRLLPERLNARSVAKAKQQYLGQVAVSNDNRENTVFRAARSTCFFGAAMTDKEYADAIGRITPEELCSAAERLLDPAGMSSLELS